MVTWRTNPTFSIPCNMSHWKIPGAEETLYGSLVYSCGRLQSDCPKGLRSNFVKVLPWASQLDSESVWSLHSCAHSVHHASKLGQAILNDLQVPTYLPNCKVYTKSVYVRSNDLISRHIESVMSRKPKNLLMPLHSDLMCNTFSALCIIFFPSIL